MAGVILRIVSSRAPYRRAGVNFDPTGHKTIVATEVALADLDEARLEQLLLDPHLDVTAGDGRLFKPVGEVADVLDLVDLVPGPSAPRRDTLAVIAEHQRLELERGRDAVLPGGDDEATGDQASTNTTGAAPDALAAAADAAQPVKAPAEPAAGEGDTGAPAATAPPQIMTAQLVPPAAEPIGTSIAPPPPKGPPRARKAPAQK